MGLVEAACSSLVPASSASSAGVCRPLASKARLMATVVLRENSEMAVQHVLKRSLIAGAAASGMLHILASSKWRQNRLLILCYHGISQKDEHRWSNLFVSPEFFRHRLEILASKGYQVLPLGVAADHLYQGTLPPKSVVITFDDGFYDFHQHAMPALARHGMPATLYLTTYYASHPHPIFNLMLSYLFWRGAGKTLNGAPWGLGGSLRLHESAAENQPLVNQFLHVARSRDTTPEQETEMARQIAESLGVDFDELLSLRLLQLMNADEVMETASAGIDLQLHTHRHRTPREEDKFHREIIDNREWIMQKTAEHPVHFCYPSGVYYPEVLPWLRAQEVKTATTCDHALATRSDDPLLLPRLLDSMAISGAEFESWLSGLSTLLPHRRIYAP